LEFDDLIPMGTGGRVSSDAKQRLSALKRSTGNSGALGNYFIIAIANRLSSEDDIPTEIKDRFKPLQVYGPQTPVEYGQIIRNGLEQKEKLGLVDSQINWGKVGGYLIGWKERLDSIGDRELAIGRGYKIITQQLAAKTKKPIETYLNETLGKSPQFHKQFYRDKLLMINEKAIYNAIDYAMHELMKSRNFLRPGEHIQENKQAIPVIS